MAIAEKLARRFHPAMRRGLLVGNATRAVMATIDDGGEESECWGVSLTRESDPAQLSEEAAAIGSDEADSGGIRAVRLRCYDTDGDVVSECRVSVGQRKESGDVVGDALLPKGEREERSLLRQSMRHAENSSRTVENLVRVHMLSLEKREASLTATLDNLLKANNDLHAKYMASVEKNAEAVRQDRAHEIELLRASTEQDAIKEGITLIKDLGPRIAGYFTGENILHPLVGIVAKLTPEQVALMRDAGVLTEAEAEKLGKAASKAREQLSKQKALPANGAGKSH